MKCSFRDCTGHYEQRSVVHTVRRTDQIIVIDGVPAEVCDVCGDVLLTPPTVRRIEEILRDDAEPMRTAPIYEFASSSGT